MIAILMYLYLLEASVKIISHLKYVVEVMMENKQLKELDNEWLQLVEDLMESNLSKTEFKAFLEYKKIEKENKEK